MFQLIQKSKGHLPVKTNFLVKPITIDELKKAIKNIPNGEVVTFFKQESFRAIL